MNFKRYLLVIGLLMALAIPASAQTYYYKYLYTVNSAGQKFIDENYQSMFNSGKSPKYITFSSSKSSVALTDANGIGSNVYYQYMGQENGIREYRLDTQIRSSILQLPDNWGTAYMQSYSMGGGTIRMFFNSDYSRVNIQSDSGIHVLQRASKPEANSMPNQLY